MQADGVEVQATGSSVRLDAVNTSARWWVMRARVFAPGASMKPAKPMAPGVAAIFFSTAGGAVAVSSAAAQSPSCNTRCWKTRAGVE